MDILKELPVRPGWGRGWGTYNVICPTCENLWIAQAPVGATGAECPICGSYHDLPWEGLPNELPNDGCWVTGRLDGDF